MKEEALRRRAARIASGGTDPTDLATIFLAVREGRSDLVGDIGNFVGHESQRERGVAWQGIQRLAIATRYGTRFQSRDGFVTTKEEMERAIWAALAIAPEITVQRDLKMNKARAKRVLQSAIAKIEYFDSRNPILNGPMTEEEARAFRLMHGAVFVEAVYDDKMLTRQLTKALAQKGIIDKDQIDAFQTRHAFVGAFAVSKMHQSKVVYRGSADIPLELGIDWGRTGALTIDASVPLPEIGPGTNVRIAAFLTSAEPAEWCGAEIIESMNPHPQLTEPIEMDSTGMLQILAPVRSP
jgi:hypothetical protein